MSVSTYCSSTSCRGSNSTGIAATAAIGVRTPNRTSTAYTSTPVASPTRCCTSEINHRSCSSMTGMSSTEYPLCRSPSTVHRPSAKCWKGTQVPHAVREDQANDGRQEHDRPQSRGHHQQRPEPPVPPEPAAPARAPAPARPAPAWQRYVAHPDHRSTVTASTGLVGGASGTAQYFSASSRSGSAIDRWSPRTTARPSARTHHSVVPIVGVLVGEHGDPRILAHVPQPLQVVPGLRLLVHGAIDTVPVDREGDHYHMRPPLSVRRPEPRHWHAAEPGPCLTLGKPHAEDITIPRPRWAVLP